MNTGALRRAALLFCVVAGFASGSPAGETNAQTASDTQPTQSAPTGTPARAPAAEPTSLLPTQAERERFHLLAEELRCLVCQNQTLADSDAELAADLRREVEELMLSGRSDDDIKAYLVQRYGDFVLYRPPLQRNTWLLWLGPFALLLIGSFVWWRVQRSHRSPPPGRDADGTEATLERARGLLDD